MLLTCVRSPVRQAAGIAACSGVGHPPVRPLLPNPPQIDAAEQLEALLDQKAILPVQEGVRCATALGALLACPDEAAKWRGKRTLLKLLSGDIAILWVAEK